MKYFNYNFLILSLLFFLNGFSQENRTLEKAKNYKDSIKAFSILASEINGTDTAKVFHYADKMYELGTRNNYKKGIGLSYFHRGNIYAYELKKDKAVENLNIALQFFKEINDPVITNTYIALASIYTNSENLIALEYLRKAKEISERNKTDDLTTLIYIDISQVYYNYNKFDEALNYLNHALALSKKTNKTPNIIIANTFIGDCYLKKKNYKKAIDNYRLSINSSKTPNEETLSIYSYNGLGNAFIEQKQLDLAQLNYNKAYDLSLKYKNFAGILNYQFNISKLFLLKKDYSKSIAFGKQYFEESQKIGNTHEISEISSILSKAYEELGNTEEALYYLKKHVENGTIYDTEKLNKFNSIAFEYEKQKNGLEVLKAKSKAQYWLILFIGSLSTICIIFFIFKIKIKNTKIAQVKLTNQLELKRKELEILAMHIIEKNNFLHIFKKSIENLSNSSTINTNDIANLRDLVFSNLKVTEERKDFNIYINNLHEDFFTNLSSRFPQLNENDKRLAAFIKLNYSTKEIASILNITTKSAELKRYRLRKKANIPESIDLNQYFSNL
jgi:tetratricopeptide (TPR) repeat protein